MITNFNQLMDHNIAFMDKFVDLKVEGWKAYSKALNAYTFSYYKKNLDEMDAEVEKLADQMKGSYRMKKGIC